jgi:hypothetical protein
MARRRMFSLDIIDTDEFLEMPVSSRELYFELGLRADDDGFIGNPKRIMKMCNASDDDIKNLGSKKFIIGFDNGIIVIRHWKIHNYIQSDRYHETIYLDKKEQILIEDNGVYTNCIQNGSAGKVRIGEVSQGKVSQGNIYYTGKFFEVVEERHNKYMELFPTLNIDNEYKKMEIWLEDNPKKRKTEKGYPRFISGWLNRALSGNKFNKEDTEELIGAIPRKN